MMWRITLPCILPTIMIMLIIRIGHLVEVGFEYIILLYRPSTFEAGRRRLDIHLPNRPAGYSV